MDAAVAESGVDWPAAGPDALGTGEVEDEVVGADVAGADVGGDDEVCAAAQQLTISRRPITVFMWVRLSQQSRESSKSPAAK